MKNENEGFINCMDELNIETVMQKLENQSFKLKHKPNLEVLKLKLYQINQSMPH